MMCMKVKGLGDGKVSTILGTNFNNVPRSNADWFVFLTAAWKKLNGKKFLSPIIFSHICVRVITQTRFIHIPIFLTFVSF